MGTIQYFSHKPNVSYRKLQCFDPRQLLFIRESWNASLELFKCFINRHHSLSFSLVRGCSLIRCNFSLSLRLCGRDIGPFFPRSPLRRRRLHLYSGGRIQWVVGLWVNTIIVGSSEIARVIILMLRYNAFMRWERCEIKTHAGIGHTGERNGLERLFVETNEPDLW